MNTITICDNDGNETAVPARWEVCARCQGNGIHDCWEGGMTGSEMAEQGPEFAQDYADGMYSVRCNACDGKRVVAVLDRRRATIEQQAMHDQDEQAKAYDEALYRMETACYGDR